VAIVGGDEEVAFFARRRPDRRGAASTKTESGNCEWAKFLGVH